MKPLVTPSTIDELPLWGKAGLALEILGGYCRARWLMRREDGPTAVARLRRRQRARVTRPVPEAAAPMAGARLGHAVVRTLSPLPADSRCLFRSLTLTWLLERRGIESSLVLAVRTNPFGAHAWVEHRGQPLLPPGDSGYERLVEL